MAKKHFRCDYSQFQSEPYDNAVCIPLTQGKHAIIDADDFDLVGRNIWFCHHGYARTKSCGAKYLHQLLLDVPKGMCADHKNGNRLDNRRQNLRVCTYTENAWNKGKRKTTKYKGVYFDKRMGKWRARMLFHGERIYISSHETPEDAARAYNIVALAHYGEFARLNTIEENQDGR